MKIAVVGTGYVGLVVGAGTQGLLQIQAAHARVNGTTSFDVSASQCNRTASDPGGLCNAPVGEGGCSYSPSLPFEEVGSGCRGANFQGASADGSRVFFTARYGLASNGTSAGATRKAAPTTTRPAAMARAASRALTT